MTRSSSEQGTGPATGMQSILGPSLPAGLRPGNTLHTFLPSLAAAVQMLKDAVDARPGESRTSLRCFTHGKMANKCCLSKLWAF